MTGGTPPLLERGCYFFLTLPPPPLREPELEPRDTEPREPLDRPADDEPTLAEPRPDEDPLDRTVEDPGVALPVEGRE
jgi:hypothetical protein